METILLDDFLDNGIIREKSFREMVDKLDLDQYKDKKVIIKGCASVTVPTWAYLILQHSLHKSQKRSIMGNHDMQSKSIAEEIPRDV